MTITRSSVAERERRDVRTAKAPRRRHTERKLLAVVSGVVLLGLFLTYRTQTIASDILEAQLREGDRVHLNTVRDPEALLPHLGVFADPDDRRFAAEHVVRFLLGEEPTVRHRIEDVGELREIRVSESEIDAAEGLEVYRRRLQEAQQRWSQLETPPEARTLALFTLPQLREVADRFVVRTPGGFAQRFWMWVLLYVALFYAVHLLWSVRRYGGDPILLPALHLLTGLGLMMMVTLRDPLRDELLFPGYVAGVLLGAAAFYAFSQIDLQRSVWRRLAYVPLLLSLLLSLVLVLFGSGPGGSDARINLRLFGLSVQPVEVIKILLVLFFAGYFAGRWEFLRTLREGGARLRRWLRPLERNGDVHRERRLDRAADLFRRLELPRLEYVLPVFAAVGLTLLFFFFQKDMGPALIIACLFLSLYGVARGRWLAAGLGLAGLAAAFWISYEVGVPATVAQRIHIWLSPWDNRVTFGGDHVAHGFWALAAGGLTGAGLGLGDPAFVPQAHTDFILAAIGEEMGFIGLLVVFGVYALLLYRAYRIACRAPSVYTFFLALGIALLTAYQLILIGGGVLGLLPLSGVISPFLNVGKSSMVANFVLFGLLASISAVPYRAPETEPLQRSARPLLWVVGGLLVLIVGKAAFIQVIRPDRTLVHGAVTVEADGVARVRYNPRLMEAARRIPRGTVYDRNGIPLATSRADVLERHADTFERLGVRVVDTRGDRFYPFGPLTFHLLGDLDTRRNMGAENTSFLERDERAWLRGYDDLRELIPLVRHRGDPDHPQVRAVLERERDLHLTLDVRLQRRVAEILQERLRAAGLAQGAAVVLDADTGALLASVTVPYAGETPEALLDRPRYGVYPPGSTFKLVTAVAALQEDPGAADQAYVCRELPGGQAGAFIRGWGRPIRDATTIPHGEIEMGHALAVSCNAYFAQLGTYTVGAERLFRTLKAFGMEAGLPGEPDSVQVRRLRDALPQAAIGQGPVLATPLEMARVTATIAAGGLMPDVHWIARSEPLQEPELVLPPALAAFLARSMRAAVLEGTALVLADADVPTAGKTGTAEVAEGRPHAWFTGFTPYGAGSGRLAFAVLLEHGGAGGSAAAEVSGEIVEAAADLGLIPRW